MTVTGEVEIDPDIDVYRSSGPRWSVGYTDGLRRPYHRRAHRHRCLHAGREVAAQEQGRRHPCPPASRTAASCSPRGGGQRRSQGPHRGPFGAHPTYNFPEKTGSPITAPASRPTTLIPFSAESSAPSSTPLAKWMSGSVSRTRENDPRGTRGRILDGKFPGAHVAGAQVQAQSILAEAGIESPQADARWLAEHVAETSLITAPEPADRQAKEYENLVAKRVARIPLQHLTGTMYFRNLVLPAEPGVFIVSGRTMNTPGSAGRTRFRKYMVPVRSWSGMRAALLRERDSHTLLPAGRVGFGGRDEAGFRNVFRASHRASACGDSIPASARSTGPEV